MQLRYKYPGFRQSLEIHYCNQPVLEIALGLNVLSFCIAIVDIILRRSLAGFSMLHARYYYGKKGPVCYFLTSYNKYIYGELSILLLFILSLDTLLRFIFCYFTLIYDNYVIYYVLFVIIKKLLFFHNFRICSFVILSNTIFFCR